MAKSNHLRIVKSHPLDNNPLLNDDPSLVNRLSKSKPHTIELQQHASLRFLVQEGFAYLVHQGLIVEHRYDLRGRDIIVGMYGPGEIVDLEQLFGDPQPLSDERDYASLTDNTVIYGFEKASFLSALSKSPKVYMQLLTDTCARLRDKWTQIGITTFNTVPERITYTLEQLARYCGERTEGGVRLGLDLTHQLIAYFVGTNRETVSKHLSAYKKSGYLIQDGKTITLLDGFGADYFRKQILGYFPSDSKDPFACPVPQPIPEKVRV